MILTAMEWEAVHICPLCESPQEQNDEADSVYLQNRFLRGVRRTRKNGAKRDLVIASTGVGKAVSALAAQEAILRYSPDLVVFGGIGGAVSPDFEMGDIIVAKDLIQWDMDASAVGVRKGTVPFLSAGERVDKRGKVFCDPQLTEELVDAAERVLGSEVKIAGGRVASGDRFLGKNSKEEKRRIHEYFGVDAVDMEGWSVAYTTAVYGVPFAMMRVVSDTLEGKKPLWIKHFIEEASRSLDEVFSLIFEY